MNPSKSKLTVLCQIARLIPRNLIERLTNGYGVNKRRRTFKPNYVHIKSANSNDANEAEIICSNIKGGEIVVFDKAYVDFKHLKNYWI